LKNGDRAAKQAGKGKEAGQRKTPILGFVCRVNGHDLRDG
jgi:hypothetical protein